MLESPCYADPQRMAPGGLDVDPAGNFKVFDLGGGFKFCCFMVCLRFFVEPTLFENEW